MIFRAVSAAEFDQIMRDRHYQTVSGQTEGKYFALKLQDAYGWQADLGYSVIVTSAIARQTFEQLHVSMMDGRVAVFATVAQLQVINLDAERLGGIGRAE